MDETRIFEIVFGLAFVVGGVFFLWLWKGNFRFFKDPEKDAAMRKTFWPLMVFAAVFCFMIAFMYAFNL